VRLGVLRLAREHVEGDFEGFVAHCADTGANANSC
jgi:hypothetical protein